MGVLNPNIKSFLFKFNYFSAKVIPIGLVVILNKIGLYNIGYIFNRGITIYILIPIAINPYLRRVAYKLDL